MNILLKEYRGNQQSSDTTLRPVNNVPSKRFYFCNYIAYMAEGQTDLASLGFLNQTLRMRPWLNQAKIMELLVYYYPHGPVPGLPIGDPWRTWWLTLDSPRQASQSSICFKPRIFGLGLHNIVKNSYNDIFFAVYIAT